MSSKTTIIEVRLADDEDDQWREIKVNGSQEAWFMPDGRPWADHIGDTPVTMIGDYLYEYRAPQRVGTATSG